MKKWWFEKQFDRFDTIILTLIGFGLGITFMPMVEQLKMVLRNACGT